MTQSCPSSRGAFLIEKGKGINSQMSIMRRLLIVFINPIN